MKTATKHARIYGLDILRACAILFVVYGHGGFMLAPHINYTLYAIADLDGVSIFFVLSGFLIGGILLKIINNTPFGPKELRSFWVRRWFRTLPNYYLVLLLVIVLKILDPDPHSVMPPPEVLWKYFFFLQNLHSPHPDFFPEAWSICIEECFYLIVPAALFLSFRIGRISRKRVFLLWITAIILLSTALRWYRVIHYNIQDPGVWDYHIRKQVITRLDSIMYGCLGAYLLYYYREAFYRYRNPLFFLGLLLLVTPNVVFAFAGTGAWKMHYINYIGITSGSIGTLALLPKMSLLRNGKGPVHRAITFISVISYSMYLLNLTVIIFHLMPWLARVLRIADINRPTNALVQYSLFWILTIGLSWLQYRFYERPLTAFRERVSRPE